MACSSLLLHTLKTGSTNLPYKASVVNGPVEEWGEVDQDIRQRSEEYLKCQNLAAQRTVGSAPGEKDRGAIL